MESMFDLVRNFLNSNDELQVTCAYPEGDKILHIMAIKKYEKEQEATTLVSLYVSENVHKLRDMLDKITNIIYHGKIHVLQDAYITHEVLNLDIVRLNY